MRDDYPYLIQGHMYQYDLHWIVENIQNIWKDIDASVELHTIKYADPIQWDITTQYQANTVVVDPKTGTAYISTKPVPSGILLTDTNYWTVVFNFQKVYTDIMKNISENYEEGKTATVNLKAFDLVWVDDILYYALHNINIGDAYVPNANIKQTTVEDMLKISFRENMLNFIGGNRTTTLENDTLMIAGDYTVTTDDYHINANNLDLNTKNPLIYKTPNAGKLFNTVPFADKNSTYNVLVENNNTQYIPFSAKSYGIFGDGETDVADKIEAHLNQYGYIFLDQGDYILKRSIQVDNAVIYGAGMENTNLIFTNASDSGININITIDHVFAHTPTIENVSILTTAHTANSALTIDGTNVLADRFTIRPSLKNVMVGSYTSPQNASFDNALNLKNINGAVIDSCAFIGGVATSEPNYSSHIGINIVSNTEPHGTEFLISNSKISLYEKGINLQSWEGLQLINCVILANRIGLNTESNVQYPHIAITNCHFNSANRNILVKTSKEVILCNNLFYCQNVEKDDIACNVELQKVDNSIIIGNIFDALTSYRVNNLIIGGKYNIISNNRCVSTNNSVSIWLLNESSLNKVYNNYITNSTTAILDNGNHNEINVINIAVLDTPPTNPKKGDIWYNTTSNQLQIMLDSVKSSSNFT